MAEYPTARSLANLEQCVDTCPAIDNHAHNIYRQYHLRAENLLTITTEASEQALEDTRTSLPHLRAARQLRMLYRLPEDADWEAIVEKRAELLNQDPDVLTMKCLANTQTILIDDGFDNADILEPYQEHSRFTRSRCKRLIRIEELASDILSSHYDQNLIPTGPALSDHKACSLAWTRFLADFEAAIAAAIESQEVAGFKSAICFTTGLAITTGSDDEIFQSGFRSFQNEFLPDCVASDFSIEAKDMNGALVIRTCKLIADAEIAKPLQFHTGIGNKEIPVLESNPACLQPLIAAFPTVQIVLLHASYPYTRIAGHLATVFKNVYLDIGAVFPEVSRDGQERVLRECLELTPWSKLLWSTDGHWFPETFWLADLQGREAMKRVFGEYVDKGDLTVQQAVRAVKAVLFENANSLYGLGLRLDVSKLGGGVVGVD
ncbi:hypothetical protein G7Y79_00046g082560 [Physcia stellaris]|nr:hypothetical protein G7Y79_00046g082560 [Physcia stellaris]